MHVSDARIRTVLSWVFVGLVAGALVWARSRWGLVAVRWFLCGASTLAVLNAAAAWKQDLRTHPRRVGSDPPLID